VDIFPNIGIPVISSVGNFSGLVPKDMNDRIVYMTERASGDSRCVPARELEARRSAGSSREGRLEAHYRVLQNEAHRYRAT